jgi:hypothetical protein
MTLLVMSVLLWALYEADPLALLSADGLGSSTKLTIGRTTAETADSPVPIQRPSSEPSQSSNQSGSAKTADELAQTKTRENSVVPQRQDGDEPIPGGQPQNRTFGNSGTEPPAARSEPPVARSEPVFPSTGFSSSGSRGPEAPADKPENARQSNQAPSRPDVAGNLRKPYENPESRSSIPEPAQPQPRCRTRDSSDSHSIRAECKLNNKRAEYHPKRKRANSPIQTIDVYAGGAHIIIICNLRSRRGARESGC